MTRRALRAPIDAMANSTTRWLLTALAILTVCSSTLMFSPRQAGAQPLKEARAEAAALLKRMNAVNQKVEGLGQKYNEAQLKLVKINKEIANTQATVNSIEGRVKKDNQQLRDSAIFAYVNVGVRSSTNPLFSSDATKLGATNVYNQLAEGNVSSTIAGLKNYKIQLTQQRAVLASKQAEATAANAVALSAYAKAQSLQRNLQSTLNHVKGRISSIVRSLQAEQAARDGKTLTSARPNGIPAPPTNTVGGRAVRAAETFLGVWYRWGGASRNGVDCSGLTMLAYAAAGVSLPHFSGGQWNSTVRVPLYNIQPGDLLFYGWHGNSHESMYIGGGKMIEASHSGTRVHIVGVRLGYGFAGIGRVRG